MSNPFDKKGNRESLEMLLDTMKGAMADIDAFRELLESLVENPEPGTCEFMIEEMEQMDATLFGIHNTLHVYGLQTTRHLLAIDQHEASHRASASMHRLVSDATERAEANVHIDEKDLN